MSAAEKKPYQDKAIMVEKLYTLLFPGYRFKPRRSSEIQRRGNTKKGTKTTAASTHRVSKRTASKKTAKATEDDGSASDNDSSSDDDSSSNHVNTAMPDADITMSDANDSTPVHQETENMAGYQDVHPYDNAAQIPPPPPPSMYQDSQDIRILLSRYDVNNQATNHYIDMNDGMGGYSHFNAPAPVAASAPISISVPGTLSAPAPAPVSLPEIPPQFLLDPELVPTLAPATMPTLAPAPMPTLMPAPMSTLAPAPTPTLAPEPGP